MTYEAFCEYVKNHILDGMEEKEVMAAVIKDVKKNNNIVVKALVVAKNETDIFYNIYLEDYYMEYCQSEKSLEEILLSIRENQLTKEVKVFENRFCEFFNDFFAISTLCFVISRIG